MIEASKETASNASFDPSYGPSLTLFLPARKTPIHSLMLLKKKWNISMTHQSTTTKAKKGRGRSRGFYCLYKQIEPCFSLKEAKRSSTFDLF